MSTPDLLHVKISRNTLVDRLRKLHADLSDENRHTDALLLDLAIQALAPEPRCTCEIDLDRCAVHGRPDAKEPGEQERIPAP